MNSNIIRCIKVRLRCKVVSFRDFFKRIRPLRLQDWAGPIYVSYCILIYIWRSTSNFVHLVILHFPAVNHETEWVKAVQYQFCMLLTKLLLAITNTTPALVLCSIQKFPQEFVVWFAWNVLTSLEPSFPGAAVQGERFCRVTALCPPKTWSFPLTY